MDSNSAGGCGRPECGPANTTETWKIDASILNILWGDVFPRLIARGWKDGAFLIPYGTVQPGALIAAVNQLRADAHDNAVGPKTPFNLRAQLLVTYLGGGNRIPIRFVGEGGFDCVLSNDGLDLFAPPEPGSELEVLRYYRFRRTGRTTIGIPGYLDAGQALAFDVMSPTGPGQIIADLHVYDSMPVKTSDSTCYLENLDCLEVSPLPDLEPAREPTGVRARIPNGVSFSVSNYLAATDRVRCWQVEGAVYRAILTELPRVIAEIWIERIVGSSVHPKSYHSRFQPASGELADIFRERLETSLPKGDRMTFDVRPANDVEITNQGFWLPEAVAMPLKPAMLDAILEGKAGNPVFTDSRRPPRAF